MGVDIHIFGTCGKVVTPEFDVGRRHALFTALKTFASPLIKEEVPENLKNIFDKYYNEFGYYDFSKINKKGLAKALNKYITELATDSIYEFGNTKREVIKSIKEGEYTSPVIITLYNLAKSSEDGYIYFCFDC